MEWVFDNIWILLAIAGAIAQTLIKKKAPSADDGTAPSEETFEDPMLAERTRKIREDIQQKIEARRRADGQMQPVPQREVVTEQMPEWMRELPPVVQEAYVPPRSTRAEVERLETQRHAEVLEQQAALADQLRHAKATKAALPKRAAFETAISERDSAQSRARGVLLGELRNPAALRRAFILREVLGPPVAMKR